MRPRLWEMVLLIAIPGIAAGQSSDGEAAYATTITRLADSAIRRLDFFPARAQLRVQMLFLTPSDSSRAVFTEIARRSSLASQEVAELVDQFQSGSAPEDLARLHAQLGESLRAAAVALDHLSTSANACAVDMTSVTRCQSPFSAASTSVARAYSRYLDVRSRVREQIADTQTVLPAFVMAQRAP